MKTTKRTAIAAILTDGREISLRINDHVTGTYHDVAFSGTIDSGDYSGGIGVKLDTPIVAYGIERKSLYISDRTCIETVERGEEVECRHHQGHIFPVGK